MHTMRFSFVALFFSVPLLAIASPLAWTGAPAYSGASGPANGGSATGGGGTNLIKVLSHNGGSGGDSTSGNSLGGGGRKTMTNNAKGGGAGFTGATNPSNGGNSSTDPDFNILDVLSDNGASGGQSGSGDALGGNAGNALS